MKIELSIREAEALKALLTSILFGGELWDIATEAWSRDLYGDNPEAQEDFQAILDKLVAGEDDAQRKGL